VSGLLPHLADGLARLSARWVPDAFSIAALLTFVALALGLTVGGANPAQCALAWGNGVWALLSFGMQIALVIFAGYVLAVAPPVARAKAEVVEDPPDRELLGEEGDHLHLPAAESADERIDLVPGR
jgi:short subunit fatty acids transporter